MNVALEYFEGLGAFDGDPDEAEEEEPDGGQGDELFESLCLFVAVELPLAEAALLEEADELGVLHAVVIAILVQERVGFDGLAAQDIFDEGEHVGTKVFLHYADVSSTLTFKRRWSLSISASSGFVLAKRGGGRRFWRRLGGISCCQRLGGI